MHTAIHQSFNNIFLHTPECNKKEVIESRKREFAADLMRNHIDVLLGEIKESADFIPLEKAIRDIRIGRSTKEEYEHIGRRLYMLLCDTADELADEMEKSK